MANRVQIAALLVLGLLAVGTIAQGATSHSSSYKGAPGKDLQAAKIALLDQYAKTTGNPYKIVAQTVGANTYSVTYSFTSAKALSDFQAWQYKQASYNAKLSKYSQTPRVSGK